jgi:hypothetical protein
MKKLTKLITERLLKEVGGQDILKDFGEELLKMYLKIENHYGKDNTSRTMLPSMVANTIMSVTGKLRKRNIKEEEDMDWIRDVDAFRSRDDLPPIGSRKQYPSNKFLSELSGMGENNFREWLNDPWDYEPNEHEEGLNMDWGESDDWVIKNQLLGSSNGKWEFISDETGTVDIWDGAHIEQLYVYNNKEDGSYWEFAYVHHYDEEEWYPNLREVFPIAEKIVFG